MEEEIVPGSRVLVWDYQEFVDDIKTPNCWRRGVVMCRYGERLVSNDNVVYGDYGEIYGKPDIWDYPDMIDVIFDHRPQRVSKGHFISSVKGVRI